MIVDHEMTPERLAHARSLVVGNHDPESISVVAMTIVVSALRMPTAEDDDDLEYDDDTRAMAIADGYLDEGGELVKAMPKGSLCEVETTRYIGGCQGYQFELRWVDDPKALPFFIDEADLVDGFYPFTVVETAY